MLWFVGMWEPETDNRLVKTFYAVYSIAYRGIFLYMYTLTQILFFIKVEGLKDVADALFVLMTQICLLYKIEKFYSNRYRIRDLVKSWTLISFVLQILLKTSIY